MRSAVVRRARRRGNYPRPHGGGDGTGNAGSDQRLPHGTGRSPQDCTDQGAGTDTQATRTHYPRILPDTGGKDYAFFWGWGGYGGGDD